VTTSSSATLQDPVPSARATAASLSATDAVAVTDSVAARLRVAFDASAVADSARERSFVVDTNGKVPALGYVLGTLGIDTRWAEIPVRSTQGVWVTVGRWHDIPNVIVAVLGRRGLRYDVEVFAGGTVTRHRMFASSLIRALGASSGTVHGLVTTPSQPLARIHDPNGKLTPWKRTWRLLTTEREDVWVTVVYGAAVGLLSLVLPVAVQALVTTVAFGSVLQPLVVLTVLFAIASATAGLLHVLRAWVVETIQQRLFVRAVTDISGRITGMPASALDRLHVPDLLNRFFEVPNMQKSLALLLVDGVGLLLQTVVGLSLLAFYHPLLLGFAIVLVLLLAIVVFGFGRGAVATALDESRTKYHAVGWLEHLARIPSAFKSERGRRLARGRAEQMARHYLDARRQHFRKLLRQISGGVAIAVIGTTSLLGLGGYLVMNNQLTLGQLIAAELVMAALAAAFVKLGKQLESVYDLVQGTTKLGLLIDLPAERRSGEHTLGDGPMPVRLSDLSYSYGGRAALRRCTAVIAAGESVAICGMGGSGKSTLLDLLSTLRPPSGGAVEFDGCDVRLLDLASLRDVVTLVRAPELVDGSLLANLRLLRPDAELPEVGRVLEALALDDVVQRLPAGLSTHMQPGGAPLSSSQARRVGLARALLSRPRLLVIDGALDDLGLPADRKDAVLDAVLGRQTPWTTVVVSSDPDVRARCDRALTLNDGVLEDAR